MGGPSLPEGTAEVNDTVLLDATIRSVGDQALGSLAIPLPALSQHVVHQFLRERRDDGKPVLIRTVRPGIQAHAFEVDGEITAIDTDAARRHATIEIAAGRRPWVVDNLREGHWLLIAAADLAVAGTVTESRALYQLYEPDAPPANDLYQAILDISDDGAEVRVSPGFGAAAPAIDAGSLFVRQPGRLTDDTSCTVTQLGHGDHQPNTPVGATAALAPLNQFPRATPYLFTEDPTR